MMSSFMIVNANPYWQDGAKYGNVEVKYSYEESHPIPNVVAYLKTNTEIILISLTLRQKYLI